MAAPLVFALPATSKARPLLRLLTRYQASSSIPVAPGTSVSVAVFVMPDEPACTVTARVAETLSAVSVKLADVPPAGTVTLAGTVTYGLLLDKLTGNAFGAAPVKVTTHVPVAGVVMLAGEQFNPASATVPFEAGGFIMMPIDGALLPPRAVTVADCALETLVALALKFMLEAPAGIVTEAGTLNAGLLLAI